MGNGGGGPASRRLDRVTEADQALRAWQLRIRGVSYRDIAAEMGVSVGTVSNRLSLFQKDRIDPEIAGLRQLEADRLDDLCRRAYEVLEADHFVVQLGKIVRDSDGNPLQDQDITLKAINTVLRLTEARAKLLGLQAPIQANVQVTETAPVDIELLKLFDEARARNDKLEAEIKAQPPRPNPYPQAKGDAA